MIYNTFVQNTWSCGGLEQYLPNFVQKGGCEAREHCLTDHKFGAVPKGRALLDYKGCKREDAGTAVDLKKSTNNFWEGPYTVPLPL
jgi:hypothetical protein